MLYAKWEAVTYSISYTMNGGTNSGSNPSTYNIESNNITLADASKSGWTFDGWTGNGTTTPTKNLVLSKGSTEDKTFVAHFSKTITLTQRHGGDTETTQQYTLTDSETEHTFTLVTTQNSYDGWTFQGWLNNATPKVADYGKTANITISEDKTVYATYSRVYTATFIDYNGTSKRTTTRQATAYGNDSAGGVGNQYGTITVPSQATYTGWTSGGWSSSTANNASATSGVTNGATLTLSSDPTYYGIYSQSVTLSYAANGGNSTPSSQSGTRKTNSYSISSYSNPSFTLAAAIGRSGYNFTGWAVSAPISATKSAGVSITPTSGTALTATAQWEKKGISAAKIAANPELYYGQEVTNYTAGGGTYRIFYVDTEGKFGEKNIVYLKMDNESDYTELTYNQDQSYYSTADLNIMKNMNPKWGSRRINAGWSLKEQSAMWLCAPTGEGFSKAYWNKYYDSSSANYVIGAPSLEMYAESYNDTVHSGGNTWIEASYGTKYYPGYDVNVYDRLTGGSVWGSYLDYQRV